MTGKYGSLIKEARKQDNQKARKEEAGEDVNLCVKVPLAWRRHWASEAKRRGVFMTEVIVRALKAEFGEP
jgi:hypothetical protein